MARIRLYVDAPLGEGQAVPLPRAQAHYLFNVMRLGVGDALLLFNGRDGEWQGQIVEAGKRGGLVAPRTQTRPQSPAPDLWLAFAPVKKARMDFIVEKATELGVARLCPVITRRTQAERVRQDRIEAQVIEAAEQCGRLDLPQVDAPQALGAFLDGLTRPLLFAWERHAAAAPSFPEGPAAVLIGPEGGFAPEEAAQLLARPGTHAISLGPRILRADTAAVVALSLWHVRAGRGFSS